MPLYEYGCPKCENNFEIFYKSLPSEKKQQEAPCPDCDTVGKRLISPFLTSNTSSSGIEKAMGNNAMTVNVGGRPMPAYQDANGQVHEFKSISDVKHWQKSNQYGKPRMVEWTNPKTGERSLVPQRIRMIADPISGEPLDMPTVKESVKMVEVDSFTMPTETRTGIPIDPKTGTPKVTAAQMQNAPFAPGGRRLMDPESGRPMTLGNMWGSEPGGNSDKAYVKAVLSGKHQSQSKD